MSGIFILFVKSGLKIKNTAEYLRQAGRLGSSESNVRARAISNFFRFTLRAKNKKILKRKVKSTTIDCHVNNISVNKNSGIFESEPEFSGSYR